MHKCMKVKENGIYKKSFIKELFYISIKYDKKYFLNLIFSYILQSIVSVIYIYILQNFIDNITMQHLIWSSFFTLLAIVLIRHVIDGYNVYSINLYAKKVSGTFNELLIRKTNSLKAVNYKNIEFLNHLNSAREGANSSSNIIIFFISAITYYIPYYIYMCYFISTFNKFLGILGFIICIPTVLSQLFQMYLSKKYENIIVTIRRKKEESKKYLVDRKYYQETKIQLASIYFYNHYKKEQELYTYELKKYERKILIFEVILKIIAGIEFAAFLLLLIILLKKGNLEVSVFVVMLSLISEMFDSIENLVTYDSKLVTMNSATASKFVEFLYCKNYLLKNKNNTNVGTNIILKNVSFSYQGSIKKVLNNINLCINEGEKIALVGRNGAGKSTLAKIILELYIPTSGSIKFKNAKTTSDYFNDRTFVLQDFSKYKMSLYDNVVLGDIKSDNYNEVERLLELYGIRNDDYPEKMNTILSADFGGVDLSGGQWNRIAITRGDYRTHKLIVLDEPTSALDCIEETEIYNKLINKEKNNTVIIVSHRLGLTKNVDKIIVLEDGTIIEQGNHNELMKRNGLYAQMYTEQLKIYT